MSSPHSTPSLASLISSTEACSLRPRALTLLSHGVLALACHGWPAPLARLKARLNEQQREWALVDENLGSQWPKISLACFRDGQQLTLEQLRVVHSLCRQFDDAIAAHPWRLQVRVLSGVVTLSNNLERQLFRQDFTLVRPAASGGGELQGDEQPVPESAARVTSVLAELSEATLPAYLSRANLDGRKQSFYSTQTATCNTLVALCSLQGCADAEGPPSFLREFQREVERLLPGVFYFFPWSSLHSTIRAL